MSPTTITVSGVAYEAALNPLASGVPREEGWPKPEPRRVGRGLQYRYPFTPELAEQIASHMESVGEGFMYGDPETRAEGRALLRDAARVRRLLGEVSA